MNGRPARAVVIGLGSTLRGDDAVGRIAADRVAQAVDPQQVKVLDQSAPTPELAAELAGVSLAIFLDAAADGPPADAVVTRRLSGSDELQAMTHRWGPDSLLALAGQLYGQAPDAYAMTVGSNSFELRDCQLSPAAAAACDLLVQETLRLLSLHRAIV